MKRTTPEQAIQAQMMRDEGKTQREIAAVLGVSRPTVSRILSPEVRNRGRVYEAEYKKNHLDQWLFQRKIYQRGYRKAHRPECNACNAARRAMIAGATIGNLTEIKEIYRRAKEDPKVRCYLCGHFIRKGHRRVDHIIPLSRGGSHRPPNLAVSCDTCNGEKFDKMPIEIGLLL